MGHVDWTERAAEAIATALECPVGKARDAARLLSEQEIDDVLMAARQPSSCVAIGAILYRARLRSLGKQAACEAANEDAKVIARRFPGNRNLATYAPDSAEVRVYAAPRGIGKGR